MLGELVPAGGGDPIELRQTPLIIGRREDSHICLRFENVSGHHCELSFVNGYWKATDLRSRNGIKINGVRSESGWLVPGDTLSIAKHHFQIQYTANGTPPAEIEEDPFSRSLLEKAGLESPEHRPSRPVNRNRPEEKDLQVIQSAINESRTEPAPQGAPKPDSDESIALRFLNDL